MGSLQKPFVAKAWALSHPSEATPRASCNGTGCWLRQGHGEVSLVRALAVSCNTYFMRLADATPQTVLSSTFAGEGFIASRPLTPEAAIGLSGSEGPLRIRPSSLLDSYARLVRTPWSVGEPVRQQVLGGLREATHANGTAAGIERRGYWAKTGTVGALDGSALHTSGLALAVDDTGWAILGLIEPGTGREAAAALAGPLGRLRPWNLAGVDVGRPGTIRPAQAGPAYRKASARRSPGSEAASLVTVRLFELVAPRHLRVVNLGSAPIPTDAGYLGPGAGLDLTPGHRVGPGLVEIQAPELGLIRRLRAELSCQRAPGGSLQVDAALTRREYVGGVVRAELGDAPGSRQLELGAAVLRFLEQSPRHRNVDVCDTTHCAWFVGRGPRLGWSGLRKAVVLEAPAGAPDAVSDDAQWNRIVQASRRAGPALWTSHCGGRPLSAQSIWGAGDDNAAACPRHGPGETRPWVRSWPLAAVEQAFGASIRTLSVKGEAGTWELHALGADGSRSWRYDEAHRRLARILGWGALPSPADRIEAVPDGFRAEGVGLGHRVGLCLSD